MGLHCSHGLFSSCSGVGSGGAGCGRAATFHFNAAAFIAMTPLIAQHGF